MRAQVYGLEDRGSSIRTTKRTLYAAASAPRWFPSPRRAAKRLRSRRFVFHPGPVKGGAAEAGGSSAPRLSQHLTLQPSPRLTPEAQLALDLSGGSDLACAAHQAKRPVTMARYRGARLRRLFMPDAQSSRTPAQDEVYDDWAILEQLVYPDEQRPLSVQELIRERGDAIAAVDAISRLQRAGLIHRTTDDLIFPTRAAVRFQQIRQ